MWQRGLALAFIIDVWGCVDGIHSAEPAWSRLFLKSWRDRDGGLGLKLRHHDMYH